MYKEHFGYKQDCDVLSQQFWQQLVSILSPQHMSSATSKKRLEMRKNLSVDYTKASSHQFEMYDEMSKITDFGLADEEKEKLQFQSRSEMQPKKSKLSPRNRESWNSVNKDYSNSVRVKKTNIFDRSSGRKKNQKYQIYAQNS